MALKAFTIFRLYFIFVGMVFKYLKSRIRHFLPETFVETESGFITSGAFSASKMEPHFSNMEMDSSTKFLFVKDDWLLRNEAPLGVFKEGNLVIIINDF